MHCQYSFVPLEGAYSLLVMLQLWIPEREERERERGGGGKVKGRGRRVKVAANPRHGRHRLHGFSSSEQRDAARWQLISSSIPATKYITPARAVIFHLLLEYF